VQSDIGGYKNHLPSVGGDFILAHELHSKRTPQLTLGVFPLIKKPARGGRFL